MFDENGARRGFIQSTEQFGRFQLLFLDTPTTGIDSDVLCGARLDWVDQRLAEGDNVCLLMHHQPRDIGDPVLDSIKLSNSDDLASLLRKHSNVRQIFFGHVHRTMFLTWNGIPCASIGSPGAVAGAASPTNGPIIGHLSPDCEGLAITVLRLA